jgi:hypothetical protein
VPTAQDRTGNLQDQASSLTNTVTTAYFADRLSNQLGYPVSINKPYYFAGCATTSQCVLPSGTIPQSAWSSPATNLLKYIPPPNAGSNVFSTSAFNQVLRDDKIGERVDANTHWGALFFYQSFDDYSLDNPYPTAQGGANVPGFNGLSIQGRAQLFDLGDTKTFGANAVNECHIELHPRCERFRKALRRARRQPRLARLCNREPGHRELSPALLKGVANIVFNGGSLVIGTVPAQFDQVNNDFSIVENFSKVLRAHMLKGGVQLEYDQINTHPYAFLNGGFNFNGTETGSAYADFSAGRVQLIYPEPT